MRLPDDPNKFSSSFKYLEAAFYIPPTDEFPKGKLARSLTGSKGSPPKLFTLEEIQKEALRYDNEGIYTSIFQYNKRDFTQASYMSSLYFDLDSNDLDQSLRECRALFDYLGQFIPEDSIRVYFSGGKGFHLECEALTLNTGISEDVSSIFSFIARKIIDELFLTTIDLQVYDIRRVWRLPNSRHQKTGLFKVPCKDLIKSNASINDIRNWAVEPRQEETPEPQFSPVANAWYREFVYAFEQDKINNAAKQQDMLSRFLEQGSNLHTFYEGYKVFDQFKLMKNCPAVRAIVNRANTEHHLDHYERLFICSLLTYSEESIEFLHSILSQCSDYNFEVSNSHIQDWVKRREYGIGGRPFSCEKAKQVGISCSGCDKMEPKKKVISLSSGKYLETEEYSQPSPIRHVFTITKGKNDGKYR